MTPHVLIGKDRRVTLAELQAVARGEGVLELHAPAVETLPPRLTLDDFSSSLLASLSISDDLDRLSPSDTLASLTLLALSAPRMASKHVDPLLLTSALVDLVNVLKQSKTSLSLPKTAFLSTLAELLPESISSLLDSVSSSSSLVALASGCLSTVRGYTLARASTPIAALSAESNRANLSAFAEQRFDIQRPHRGLITTAAALRAILTSSKFVVVVSRKSSRTDEPTVAAVELIPQMHGPALEHLQSSLKTLELEFNCFPDAAEETNAVASLALRQALDAVTTLYQASQTRQGVVDMDANTISGNDLLSQLQLAVSQLEGSLVAEAQAGCAFVHEETAKAEEEAKAKEQAKDAARAASGNSAPVGKKDEFEGMTEAQKAKILKKRAEKEAKAAAKRASKKDKVSLFGAGTQPIVDVLEKNQSYLSEQTVCDLESIVGKLLSGGVQRKPKIPKGTRDYLPEQMMIRQQAFSIIRRVFESHGAVEIDTPVFELKDTLTGKYGEDSKLIYDLADQGGELLALRYDLTVPFARFLALNSVGNIKRFHIGKVYRRDQPALSKGRYREFYQCDFDIAGNYGRMVPDSESLCVVCEILDALPIGDFGIKVNHRRLLDAILDLCGVPTEKFRTICSAVDKLDKEPWSEVKREMVEEKGLDPSVADKIGTFVLDKGDPWTMYNQLMDRNKFGKHQGATEAMEDMRILFEYLEAMDKLKFMSFDMSLARGLDYYTGVIYEAVCMSGNTQVGSIGGGGRYDNLVSMFQEAGKITPCVGVSVGIERVFTLMEARLREEQGGSIKQPNVNVLVASVGEGMVAERMRLAKVLWDAKISAEFSQQENPKLKYELANALDRAIPFLAIVGEEEVKEKACKVKDLNARTEETVPLDKLVATLRAKGVLPVGCEFAAELLE